MKVFAISSHAEEHPPLIQQASEKWLYQVFKDQNTALAQAIRKNWRDAENKAIRSAPGQISP